jgi:endo-1,4-beta-xylanase
MMSRATFRVRLTRLSHLSGLTLLFCFLYFGFNSFINKVEPLCEEKILYKVAPFHIGTALNTNKLKNEERYWTLALKHYNSFTPEKILKPKYIHPHADKFDFWEMDHLMEFCQRNNIRLHGHTLVWHNAVPDWMEKFKGSSAAWDSLLKDHIQKVVIHCKGTVRSWDVVNEAFNDDGSLRKNIWLKNIGETYIEKAFRYAREADPTAKLFYNDYSLEGNGEKLNSVLLYLQQMRSAGVEVDGIGLQMHLSLSSPSIAQINEAALRIQKEGYLVHYSELDISLSADQPLFVSRKKLLAAQKKRFKEVVQGYMKLSDASRFGITLWGVSDNDSWLMDESMRTRPLLFNTHYKIKPAFCGFSEGLIH